MQALGGPSLVQSSGSIFSSSTTHVALAAVLSREVLTWLRMSKREFSASRHSRLLGTAASPHVPRRPLDSRPVMGLSNPPQYINRHTCHRWTPQRLRRLDLVSPDCGRGSRYDRPFGNRHGVCSCQSSLRLPGSGFVPTIQGLCHQACALKCLRTKSA